MQPKSHILSEIIEQGFCNPGDHWQELQDGAINDNFSLQGVDNPLFLKCFCKKTPARINRRTQYQIQVTLAEQGIAPKPLYLGKHEDFMLEPWLNLTPISASRTPRSLKIAFLAKRLAQIHDLNIEAPELDLIGDWQHYIELGASLSDEQQTELEHYQSLWRNADKSTFCHHDLASSHVCVSPQNITLDWEYAALSNPAFDIACCAWINELNEVETRDLIKMYAAESGDSWRPLVEMCNEFIPLANFTSELWLQVAGLSREQVVDD